MSQEELGIVLQLIEQWAYCLSGDRLNEQCRQSGADFFSYMTGQKVDAGWLAKLITETTGHNPRQLWTVQDAELLKDAIFRYEASIQEAQRTGDPKRSARRFWG